MNRSAIIREYNELDSISEITTLLHKSYAPLAQLGLKYLASHQDEKTTLQRLTKGQSFVAVDVGRIVGVISVYPPRDDASAQIYRQLGVFHFGQFAIDPSYQGKGIGKLLYMKVENYCRTQNGTTIALDTSENATHLISMYENWGFKIVDKVKWDITNYRSVIMAKPLN
jgi:GNAT superfamily N-acetyltransferase